MSARNGEYTKTTEKLFYNLKRQYDKFPQIPGRKTEKARRGQRAEMVDHRDVISWVTDDLIYFCHMQSDSVGSDDDSSNDDEPQYENDPNTKISKISEELHQARQRQEFHEEDGTNKPVSGMIV